MGRIADGRRHNRRYGGDQDVAVLDVRQLVGNHSADLPVVEQLQQAGRHGDHTVLRVSTGRERVRLASSMR